MDWQILKKQQDILAITNNDKENKTCCHHKNKVVDLVLISEKSIDLVKKVKLSSPGGEEKCYFYSKC